MKELPLRTQAVQGRTRPQQILLNGRWRQVPSIVVDWRETGGAGGQEKTSEISS